MTRTALMTASFAQGVTTGSRWGWVSDQSNSISPPSGGSDGYRVICAEDANDPDWSTGD